MDADQLALIALSKKQLLADTENGIIFKADGDRAELLDTRTGYGRVRVWSRPLRWARAHRIIWIAANGPIDSNVHIKHRNGIRWDNRIANLELHEAPRRQRLD